jgi:hypothetical protein
VPWETERVIDIVQGFVAKWVRAGLQDPELLEWDRRFREDKWRAARAFWQAMYDGMIEAFEQGITEPVRTK